MRAAAIDDFGSPDAVHTARVPVPEIAKREVLVHVAIAGVGTWDPDVAAGSVDEVELHFPAVLGSDGAGTVVAVGSDVERFAVGDRVYGWGFGNPKGGFFAEYIAIKDHDLAPIPDGVSFEEAGALAVAGITALQGLEHLELEAGDSVLVVGASGGLGHIAVQLAKRMGLRVFAIASGDDGVELARQVGADRVVDGKTRALAHALRGFAPDGFDGALVFASGRKWTRELAHVVKGGSVAWPNGVEPRPDVRRGVDRKPYDGEQSPAAFDRLAEVIRAGLLHVELSKIYSLDEAAQALRDVKHHHVGKLAIAIDRSPATAST